MIRFVYCGLYIKHLNLLSRSEKLEISWDKDLYDSNVQVAYRRPRLECLQIGIELYGDLPNHFNLNLKNPIDKFEI